MTFADEIEQAANGEPIEGVVIGAFGWDGYNETDEHQPANARQGALLLWSEAKPLLDYEYKRGYGAPDCHAIYAWTASRVLFVGTYDGSTWVTWVPRNPTAGRAGMIGGG